MFVALGRIRDLGPSPLLRLFMVLILGASILGALSTLALALVACVLLFMFSFFT